MFQLGQTLLFDTIPLTPLPPASKIFLAVSQKVAGKELSIFVHIDAQGRPVNIHHQDWLQ